ncbi:MAG: hypothetical protein U0984_15780 [Prosthecobacter sp.]|nr:hypothetical protein [Prosthecobacter sp.]
MNRKSIICLTILEILRDCGGHALPEGTLRAHLNMRERPAVFDDEAQAALAYLAQQGHARAMPGEMGDDEPRWLITEKGQAALLQR